MANNYKGINTEAVPSAQKAVTKYVDNVEAYLNRIKSPNVSSAFKGRYAQAIQAFIDSVVEEVKVPLKELHAFSDHIEAAKRNYQKKDEELQSSIGSQQ